MPELKRYVLNCSIAGVGDVGEIVEASPVLWAVLIEGGYMSEIDADGWRIDDLPEAEPLVEDDGPLDYEDD